MESNADSLYERIGGRENLLNLLKHFYADVRQHEVIGPIFIAKIQDWPAHLEKIADFWSGLIGGSVKYPGGLMAKHMSLGIGEEHFEAWLGLWGHTCRAHLPETEAAEMMQRAEMIGQRMRGMLQYHQETLRMQQDMEDST